MIQRRSLASALILALTFLAGSAQARTLSRRADLIALQEAESRANTPQNIRVLNEKTLAQSESDTEITGNRIRPVSPEFADAMVKSILTNPVTSVMQRPHYDPGDFIGFCFGRATYVHLMALRYGFARADIQKVWIVGPQAGGWEYHVATMIKTAVGWRVIDSLLPQSVTVREWFDHWKGDSLDGKLRLYITEAEKFAPTVSKYSRVQLGLDLTKSDDFYNHYFKDLVAFTASLKADADFTHYGLPTPTSIRNPNQSCKATLTES
jgi:hypothetical protein